MALFGLLPFELASEVAGLAEASSLEEKVDDSQPATVPSELSSYLPLILCGSCIRLCW